MHLNHRAVGLSLGLTIVCSSNIFQTRLVFQLFMDRRSMNNPPSKRCEGHADSQSSQDRSSKLTTLYISNDAPSLLLITAVHILSARMESWHRRCLITSPWAELGAKIVQSFRPGRSILLCHEMAHIIALPHGQYHSMSCPLITESFNSTEVPTNPGQWEDFVKILGSQIREKPAVSRNLSRYSEGAKE